MQMAYSLLKTLNVDFSETNFKRLIGFKIALVKFTYPEANFTHPKG